jgi:CubicO group peptidase (beta-lactamase class C family)
MRLWKTALAGALALVAGPALTRQAPAPAKPVAAAPVATPAAASAATSGAPQLTRADVDGWLDGYMPYALKRGDIAGAVVVVVKDGQVLSQRGFGYADVAKKQPVDPDNTLFRPGSVSKLFTWTAVMQLVEQGKLNLDADVNQYLDFKIPPRDGKPVTLRNILTHTAGFEESARGNFSYDPKGPPPLGDVLKAQRPQRVFAPGTTPAYSNHATAIAGHIVARVSGMSFDDYLDRNIFGRLGMTKSSFRQPLPANLQPLMSKGYKLGSGEPTPFEMIAVGPAGSLSATGADMARFMIAHLNQGGALLKPETTRLMHESKLTIIPAVNRMALGFYEQNVNGHSVIGHGGDTMLFHSYLWIFPGDNVGVFVSMNSGGKDGATGAIRDALLSDFADRYFPAPNTDGRVDAKAAAEHARMMVGTYNNSRRMETNFLKVMELAGGQVKITLDDKGGIVFGMIPGLGGQERKWVEIAPFVWRDQDSKQRLAAKVVDGKVAAFSLDMISPFMVFEPVPASESSVWLTPALLLSLLALAGTALAWPIAAIVRRRFGATLALNGKALKAHRLARGFAALAVAVIVGWAVLISAMMSDYSLLGGQLDWALTLLQTFSLIGFVGLVAAAGWNAWLVWQDKRSWLARVWSVVLVLAALVLLWVGYAFHLIGFNLVY